MTLRGAALRYFVNQGWAPEQAAGLVANLEAESSLNPDAVGDNGRSYGLAQWHGDRQARYQALMGRPIQGSTFEDQLAFVHAELVAPEWEGHAGDLLRACTTAHDAGACVSRYYERPADADGEAAKRGALAETILAAYSVPSSSPPVSPDEPPPEPAPTPTPTPTPTLESKPMGALAFLPMILQAIPELIGLFGTGPRGQTNAKAAQVVVDAVTKAAGTDGVGAALDKMAADPAAAADIKKAVLADPTVMALTEVGGGIQAARDFDLKQQAMPKPFYETSAVFWVSVMLLPLVYWFVGSMIVGGYGQVLHATGVEIPGWVQSLLAIFGGSWTGESRSGAFNLVAGLVLGGICGVYYGVSITQQRANQGTPQ